jgi:hypothetical protein
MKVGEALAIDPGRAEMFQEGGDRQVADAVKILVLGRLAHTPARVLRHRVLWRRIISLRSSSGIGFRSLIW